KRRICSFQFISRICFSIQKEMPREFLNDFEELILTMVAALDADAYGAAITAEIEKWLGRKVTLSAVHVTLYRLEDKGYVKSKVGGATKERGGRSKRIYSITSAGVAILRSMKETRTEIWKLVPRLKITHF
ncbi:MAG TPA: PadR family transcriptional regulator, partial [Chryseosolibacter sp.]|nr:PadR family transcriptional regulator [Chryseosolibacter sp.]